MSGFTTEDSFSSLWGLGSSKAGWDCKYVVNGHTNQCDLTLKRGMLVIAEWWVPATVMWTSKNDRDSFLFKVGVSPGRCS